MNLKFRAKSVSYNEALGGDIVQVIFDEDPDDDALNPRSKNVCAAISYEFPPCDLLFEWSDGSQCGGGLKAQRYLLSEKRFSVSLADGTSIEIEHSADAETISKISALLLLELGRPQNA
jgi:hypothetical protein